MPDDELPADISFGIEAPWSSVSGRPGLSAYDRRQLLHLDAVRLGDTAAAQRLADLELGAEPWRARWATGVDLDPRLRLKFHLPPMRAVDWGIVDSRPLVAISTCDAIERPDDLGEQLQVWDQQSGQSRVLMDAPARCLSFASLTQDPVLITGHEGGLMRIWNLPEGSLRSTVDAGPEEITDLQVVQQGDETQVITLDAAGRVALWSVKSGDLIGAFDAPQPYAIRTGRLGDGRLVLATAGEGLSLWDVQARQRLPLAIEGSFHDANDVALATVEGHDLLIVLDQSLGISTYDLQSGERFGAPIEPHRKRNPKAGWHAWSHKARPARLAVVAGTLAVPTRGRVHLWNLLTCESEQPPLLGPVAHAVVRKVLWQGHELLLTGSAGDGVVALWELDVPVSREPGHDERIVELAVAGCPPIVTSVDEGGTICARGGGDGRQVCAPLRSGVQGINALAAWREGDDTIVAAGAGSRRFRDGKLRRWNLTTGGQLGEAGKADSTYVRWLSPVSVHGAQAVANVGAGSTLKVWRASDGSPLTRLRVQPTRKTGFATGLLEGRPVAIVSAHHQPVLVFALDNGLTSPMMRLDAENDFVLGLAGTRVVTGYFDDGSTGWRAVRAWHLSGQRVGPEVRADAEVTSVAVAQWPGVYIARADGTVTLTDLQTGQDLCPSLLLPRRPNAIAVADDGNLLAAFGSDVALFQPPLSDSDHLSVPPS